MDNKKYFYTVIHNTYMHSPCGCDADDGGDDQCIICCTAEDKYPPLSTYEEPMINSLSETLLPKKEGYRVREVSGNGKFLALRMTSGKCEKECINGCRVCAYEITENLLKLFETFEEATMFAENAVLEEKKKKYVDKPWMKESILLDEIRRCRCDYFTIVEFNDNPRLFLKKAWYRKCVYMN